MKNPFKRFYKTPVNIVKIEENGSYKKTYTETALASIKADLQPYSGGLAEKEYGFKEECKLRMFASNDESIKVGNYVRHDGKLYRIVYVPWSNGLLGTEALLKEIDDYVD